MQREEYDSSGEEYDDDYDNSESSRDEEDEYENEDDEEFYGGDSEEEMEGGAYQLDYVDGMYGGARSPWIRYRSSMLKKGYTSNEIKSKKLKDKYYYRYKEGKITLRKIPSKNGGKYCKDNGRRYKTVKNYKRYCKPKRKRRTTKKKTTTKRKSGSKTLRCASSGKRYKTQRNYDKYCDVDDSLYRREYIRNNIAADKCKERGLRYCPLTGRCRKYNNLKDCYDKTNIPYLYNPVLGTIQPGHFHDGQYMNVEQLAKYIGEYPGFDIYQRGRRVFSGEKKT